MEIDKQRSSTGIGKIGWVAIGFALCSVATYLLDPVQGRGRRSYVTDKGTKFKNEVTWRTNRQIKDLNNRFQGVLSKGSSVARKIGITGEGELFDDETLVQRVRSAIGRKVRHMKSIDVSAESGIVTLRGPILADEVTDLLASVRAVPGVQKLVSDLEIHETADHVPGLQGEGKPYFQ